MKRYLFLLLSFFALSLYARQGISALVLLLQLVIKNQ